MDRWLHAAVVKTSQGLPHGITSKCHLHGASTMPYRTLNSYPEMYFLAGWEMTCWTFTRTYYWPNLEVDTPLARFFFADLAR